MDNLVVSLRAIWDMYTVQFGHRVTLPPSQTVATRQLMEGFRRGIDWMDEAAGRALMFCWKLSPWLVFGGI